jgi:hypothetical protein
MVRVGVGVVGDKGEYVPPQPVSRTTEQMRMKPDFTGASFTPAKWLVNAGVYEGGSISAVMSTRGATIRVA